MKETTTRPLGRKIAAEAAMPISGYEGYLSLLFFRASARNVPVRSHAAAGIPNNEPLAMEHIAQSEFNGRLRSALRFTLTSTITVLHAPIDYKTAKRAETIPGIQQYLVQIVGKTAIEQVKEEGWLERCPQLARLENPFSSEEFLHNMWRHVNHPQYLRGLNDTAALAPGFNVSAPR